MMVEAVFLVGLVTAVALNTLLVLTVWGGQVRVWPTPGSGTWESRTFWTLFRALNVCTIVVAIADRETFFLGHWLHFAVGVPLLVGGFGLYFLACFTLGKSNTYCRTEGLVTSGIYRWTRNPQYATAIPAYAGLAITANSGYTYILATALAGSFVLMALAEEPWLVKAYGAPYQHYRTRVPRFFNWQHALNCCGAILRANLPKMPKLLADAARDVLARWERRVDFR